MPALKLCRPRISESVGARLQFELGAYQMLLEDSPRLLIIGGGDIRKTPRLLELVHQRGRQARC